jgi:retron-type reverse transcriptase
VGRVKALALPVVIVVIPAKAGIQFHPGRSAHQAAERSQKYVKAGFDWVVDVDPEKFFDKVDHDVLISEVQKRFSDRRVLRLIREYMVAGVMIDDELHETVQRTPQDAQLSPFAVRIRETYGRLTCVESAFRSLKSSLGLRPNLHQNGERADTHLLIDVYPSFF